jgi:hypothetical protein
MAWKKLGLKMESQEHTNWCWSAVATSVSNYYRSLLGRPSEWTQCTLAEEALDLATGTCCGSVFDEADCDQEAQLTVGLSKTLNLDHSRTDSMDFPMIQPQLDAKKPLCVRISWYAGAGSAHFVALAGYNTSAPQQILVRDPLYGNTQMNFADFPDAYQNGGDWTMSIYTQQKP